MQPGESLAGNARSIGRVNSLTPKVANCGNGVLDTGEQCDGNSFASNYPSECPANAKNPSAKVSCYSPGAGGCTRDLSTCYANTPCQNSCPPTMSGQKTCSKSKIEEIQECKDTNGDGCVEWSFTACNTGEKCQKGVCTFDLSSYPSTVANLFNKDLTVAYFGSVLNSEDISKSEFMWHDLCVYKNIDEKKENNLYPQFCQGIFTQLEDHTHTWHIEPDAKGYAFYNVESKKYLCCQAAGKFCSMCSEKKDSAKASDYVTSFTLEEGPGNKPDLYQSNNWYLKAKSGRYICEGGMLGAYSSILKNGFYPVLIKGVNDKSGFVLHDFFLTTCDSKDVNSGTPSTKIYNSLTEHVYPVDNRLMISPLEICDNGIDDNGDGDIDCKEYKCNNKVCGEGKLCNQKKCTTVITEICDTGLDEDLDGLIDCADPDCKQDTSCVK